MAYSPDPTLITAVSALLGSVVGASASIAMNWMTLRTQLICGRAVEEQGRRRLLYQEFIRDASNSVLDGLTHSLDQPEKLVKLYSHVSCIRLISSPQVLAAAEECCRRIVELYSKPNMTVEEILASLDEDHFDPLREFSAACRAELHQLAPRGISHPQGW